MNHPTTGLHHITAIASDGPKNLHFYQDILGMRLVKKTVNFDVPGSYHLYYGNKAGDPGTALTFFLWPDLSPARPGAGVTSLTRLAIPQGSLSHWESRLTGHRIDHTRERRFDEDILRFSDPDGLALALVERPLGEGEDIIGFDGAELRLRAAAPTQDLLFAMGYKPYKTDADRERLIAGNPAAWGQYIDLWADPEAPGARQGLGAVHHIAFRAADDTHQAAFHTLAESRRLMPSPVMDRSYFRSIYFREPGGILFEVATDEPGFTVDEPLESLGRALKLPPPLEGRRAEIEALLPPL
ncbi:MAG: ring-cleaving dioxygenase [Verrucomicrobia bacterium]|nr:ring-cleaving dioxygenase [Verrucomicrobiota bacterium]MCH8526301.1 ring-cleaving dioxygenase [Kiritimatiellia bacterium]